MPVIERVMVFLDYANINRAAHDAQIDIDYEDLLRYVVADRFLVEAFCYFPLDPSNPTLRQRDIDKLWMQGFVVTTKMGKTAGDTFKCDFDIEIAMDIVRSVHEVRPDTIILMTGDVDFVPIVEYTRRSGIRVEGAAFYSSAARDFAIKCSGFIELDKWAREREHSVSQDTQEDVDNADN